MRVVATDAAIAAVAAVGERRRGALSVTLGTGCCDSTAPYLYTDHVQASDAAVVGEVRGVPIFAPGWLAAKYADDETLVLDCVVDDLADSFSLETDLGRRLVLRYGDGSAVPDAGAAAACSIPPAPTEARDPIEVEAPHPPRLPAMQPIEVPLQYRGFGSAPR